jgi:lipid A 3-O-deacylase
MIASSAGGRGVSKVGRRRAASCRAAALAGVGVALLAALAAVPARAQVTAVAAFGLVGPEEGEKRSAVLDLEYRLSPWSYGVGPVIGVSASSDGSSFLRAGLSRDFPFGERWNANITIAGGAYQRGNGKDLGRGFEFRSAIDVSYEARPGMRFGAALAHLSNAGISEQNPGLETITFTFALTPSRMSARR